MKAGSAGSTAALGAAALAVAVLSGCGGHRSINSRTSPASSSASPTAAAVVASGAPNRIERLDAESAASRIEDVADEQRSVHIVGRVREHTGTVRVDLHAGQGQGEGVERLAGGRVYFRLVDAMLYSNGDRPALRALGLTGSSLRKAAGRWVSQPAASDSGLAGDTASLLDVRQFFEGIFSNPARLSLGPVTVYDGQPAVPLHDRSPRPSTMYVATTGQPLPLSLGDDDGTGQFRFDDYGAALHVTAPATGVTD